MAGQRRPQRTGWAQLATLGLSVLVAFLSLVGLPSESASALETIQRPSVTVGTAPESAAVDTVTNRVYVANFTSGTVSVLDGATHAVLGTITIGGNPYAVAVNAGLRRLYVTDGTGSLTPTVVNIDSNSGPLGTVESSGLLVIGAQRGVAVDTVTNKIYVVIPGINAVGIFDGTTKAPLAAPTVGTSPLDVAVNPTTRLVYVTNSAAGSLTTISADTDAVVTASISAGNSPGRVAVNSTTNKVYVTRGAGNALMVIDAANSNAISTIALAGATPFGVAVNPVTNRIFVTRSAAGQNSVTVIDGRTGTVDGSPITVGTTPHGVAVNPNTGFVYVANSGSASVSVLGAPFLAETILGTRGGLYGSGAAVNPTTNRVYVSDETLNTVTVLDGATLQPIGSPIPVGTQPKGVAVNPDTNRVYVANFGTGSSSVTVIDGAGSGNGGAGTVLGAISTGANTRPRALTIKPSTNMIYAALRFTEGVAVIDGGSGAFGALTQTIATGNGSSPAAVAYNPTNDRVYVADPNTNSVLVIDAATNTLTGPAINVGSGTGPNGFGVNPRTNRIYTSNFQNATVSVIEGATNTIMGFQIGTGSGPLGVGVNSLTNRVYVANNIGGVGTGNTVSLIDGATSTLFSPSLAVTGPPQEVAVNERTNRAYVARGNGGLSAIGPNFSINKTFIERITPTTVQVTWGSLFGTHPDDIIGLYLAPDPNSIPYASRSTSGQAGGTVNLAVPSIGLFGSYEIRLVSGVDGRTLASLYIPVSVRPVANNDVYSMNAGNQATLTKSFADGVLANDTDNDTDKLALSVQLVTPPNGIVDLRADGGFTYKPRASFTGVDSFTYKVTDPQGLVSNTATASITVSAASCGPRPPVQITRAVSGGALQVTVTSTTSANAPGNRLVSFNFGTFTNAQVTVNGQGVGSGQSVSLPGTPVSQTFSVTRVTPGQATNVPLTVVDGCGSWQTFVGGGPNAGF